MGLAGESGCGKTTLGKSLIRLDGRMRVRRAARVELDGVELPIADDRAMNAFRFREVSIVPQYAMSALNPIRKIGRMISELLALARRLLRRDAAGARAAGSRSSGSTTTCSTAIPIELSGGMKQRVVMVLSTLLDPSLLIADELTSALDVSTQKAVAEMLVEFRDRGFVKSTIVITHDLSILYQIADTILVMYAGKLAEKAPADAIIEHRRGTRTRSCCSLAARGRGALRGEAADAASPAGRRRCSTRRPAAASGPAARSRSRSAPRSRRSSRSSRARFAPAGRSAA